MKATVIRKIFGGGWYLGPTRSRWLADYALSLFDEQVAHLLAEYGETDQASLLHQEIARMKKNLEDTILTWEDESLGPETGLGIPFATGVGGKDRYKEYIDRWVHGLIVRITWDLGSAKHDAMAGTQEGQSMGPARLTPGSGAWDILSRSQGLPSNTQSLQERAIGNTEFMQRAEELADGYPEIVLALRNQFIKDALKLVAWHGIGTALLSLKAQLESMRKAGQRKQQD